MNKAGVEVPEVYARNTNLRDKGTLTGAQPTRAHKVPITRLTNSSFRLWVCWKMGMIEEPILFFQSGV